MWGFLLLITISSVFAYESPVYRQEEWNNISEKDIRPNEQYFEGIFPTRIDHFRPLNQTLVNFVSCFFDKVHVCLKLYKFYRSVTT